MRTSASQFQLMVDFMERYGDLSKPTEGAQGRASNLNRWAELTQLLNADATGDTKTAEKWRKEVVESSPDVNDSVTIVIEQLDVEHEALVLPRKTGIGRGHRRNAHSFCLYKGQRVVVCKKETGVMGGGLPRLPGTPLPSTSARHHQRQSTTPLPLTPRRRRRGRLIDPSSPIQEGLVHRHSLIWQGKLFLIPPSEGCYPTDETSPSTDVGYLPTGTTAQRPSSPAPVPSTPSGPTNQAGPQTGISPPSTTNVSETTPGNYHSSSLQGTPPVPPPNKHSPPAPNAGGTLHPLPPAGGHKSKSHTGYSKCPDLAAPGGRQPKQLRIVYWNPGGIRSHQDELRLIATEQDVHIFLLGETLLAPKHKFTLPNYSVYRRDELTPDGIPYRGTAALVRRDIMHDELPWAPYTSTRSIGVRTKVGSLQLKTYAAYKPPSTQIHAADLDEIFSDDVPTLLAGDLNCLTTDS
ncbi:hypothetical protein evm_014372 [Chilo suppressalis]|nr:hypothetical protein evm_014372 [Chilo suppressalis]